MQLIPSEKSPATCFFSFFIARWTQQAAGTLNSTSGCSGSCMSGNYSDTHGCVHRRRGTHKQRVHSSPGSSWGEVRCISGFFLSRRFQHRHPARTRPPTPTPPPQGLLNLPLFRLPLSLFAVLQREVVCARRFRMEASPQPLRVNSWGAGAQGSTSALFSALKSRHACSIKHSMYLLLWGAFKWHWLDWFTGCRIEFKSWLSLAP